MTPLTTDCAAAVAGISVSHLKNLARATGITPRRAPTGRLGRGYRLQWFAGHLFALALLKPLARLMVAPAPAITFARGIAEQPSDEALDAVLADRPYALIFSQFVCPHTVSERTVQRANEKLGAKLRAQGRDLVALKLAPLLADLQARIRAVEAASVAKP